MVGHKNFIRKQGFLLYTKGIVWCLELKGISILTISGTYHVNEILNL